MHRPFTVTWEQVLPGDPEQVWDAITCRAAAWLWEVEYEPRVGGAERGLSPNGGVVTSWDPPRRFATRAESAGGWRNALDYRLAPHADGTLVHYTHESVAEASDHARLYAECVAHTDFYRHSLAEYVRCFAGREATYVGVDAEVAFADACARLGLPPGTRTGDRVRLEPAGVPPLQGTVDYLTDTFLGVRGEDFLFRVYGRDAWNDPLTIAMHAFDPAADAAAIERDWKEWARCPGTPS